MAIIKTIKVKYTAKSRVTVDFNTGTRQHKPKKGAGSYCRKKFKTDY